jgi:hypothetical protein
MVGIRHGGHHQNGALNLAPRWVTIPLWVQRWLEWRSWKRCPRYAVVQMWKLRNGLRALS